MSFRHTGKPFPRDLYKDAPLSMMEFRPRCPFYLECSL